MNILNINLVDKKYPIYIEKGLIKNIGKEIRKIYKGKKIAIITDKNIEKFYGNEIENIFKKEDFTIKKIVVEPGEKSKSIFVLQKVYKELLDFGITRGDLIIAFGGGVVGDLGGFAASTLLRGIPFIQMPTSLLAQIDSSVGGKVAVNLKEGKNLIGSFYHPLAVFIDPNLLKTLEFKYFCDGMAEVIKYGAIKDEKLFFSLLKDNNILENIEKVIYTCCSIKKEIVEKDEKDTGDRMLLNFGHTLGHGIEKYFGYEKYTHGEAVAMGMYQIVKNSENLGITEKGSTHLIKELLEKYHLPCELPNMNEDQLLDTIKLDKKGEREFIHIILLKSIGNAFIKRIHRDEIKKYLKVKE